MTEVLVPHDAWEAGEAAVSAWLYNDGDPVQEGDVLAELMVEKSSFDLIAPAAGRLTILVEAEEAVAKGQAVARIT